MKIILNNIKIKKSINGTWKYMYIKYLNRGENFNEEIKLKYY